MTAKRSAVSSAKFPSPVAAADRAGGDATAVSEVGVASSQSSESRVRKAFR